MLIGFAFGCNALRLRPPTPQPPAVAFIVAETADPLATEAGDTLIQEQR